MLFKPLTFLLCVGGKENQQKDIDKAKWLAKQLFEEMKNKVEEL